jgi:hypothetical protein
MMKSIYISYISDIFIYKIFFNLIFGSNYVYSAVYISENLFSYFQH